MWTSCHHVIPPVRLAKIFKHGLKTAQRDILNKYQEYEELSELGGEHFHPTVDISLCRWSGAKTS